MSEMSGIATELNLNWTRSGGQYQHRSGDYVILAYTTDGEVEPVVYLYDRPAGSSYPNRLRLFSSLCGAVHHVLQASAL